MHRERQRELLLRFFDMRRRKATPLAPETFRVSASAYTSTNVLDSERKMLFRSRPLLVGLSGDAPLPGDYFTVDVDDLPIVVVRGEDGMLRALVNACRHRGARVFPDEHGHAPQRAVSCPFHSWTYDLHGRLLGQPLAREGFADCDNEILGLRPLPVAEKHGMVFVTPTAAHEADVPPIGVDEVLAGAASELSAFEFAQYVHIESRTRTISLNWKLAMDTFMESYHIFSLHRESIGPYYFSTPSLFDELGPVGRLIGVRSDVDKLVDTDESEWRLLPYGTIQYFIPPNGIVVHQLDRVETWQISPGSAPDRAVCTTSVYAPSAPEAPKKPEYYRRSLDALLAVTDGEDFAQGEQIQRTLGSGAMADLVFGRNEPALIHYHRVLADMLSNRGEVRAQLP